MYYVGFGEHPRWALFGFSAFVSLFLALFPLIVAADTNPAGDLHIEVIAAYNLVVDSNVESPSTYAPEAATLGAKICNDGADDLTNAFAYIGDFDMGTAGSYPAVTNPSTGQVGTFSLTHQGGSAGTSDATRYIGDIPAGECVTQYWLISYPRLDDNGDSVTRGTKPDDDLALTYDIWATANDGGTPLAADVTRTLTLRNEISAAANKIWPNGDNKVPDVYKAAIEATAGWDTFTPSGSGSAYPGETVSTQGIWYDLGNVGQGFDNDGDLVPDSNVWLQPIGDPNSYDPGCFRLVRTYGIVIIKLKDGGEYLIPFEDQLYFSGIPANTGGVGLVFYEYVSLDGACTAGLSPYQEVASGRDNEKFSGDYGFSIPPLHSQEPAVAMAKSVDQSIIGPALPRTLNYTIQITNSGPITAGNIAYGIPLVIHETMPAGTTYVVGSADDNIDINGGTVSTKILYSINNGATWSLTEPTSGVTNIQWWLQANLPSGATGSVTFQMTVPLTYPSTYVQNTGGLGFGSGAAALEDDAVTFLLGNNSLGDTVFKDNGTGGYFANGSVDIGESGIANVTVALYYDLDGDGVLDETDPLWGTTTSNGSSIYGFSSLPDGKYLVVVDQDDSDLPTGWTITTDNPIAIDLDSAHASSSAVSNLTVDFGFAPALDLVKALAGSSPLYAGDQATYTIDLTNRLRGSGTATGGSCTYTIWAGNEDSRTSGLPASQHFQNSTNAFGAAGPDGLYAESPFSNARDKDAGTGFSIGTPDSSITSVNALYSIYLNGLLSNDGAEGFLFFNNSQIATTTFTPAQLNAFAGTQAAQGLLTWNVTSARSWGWADFAGDLDLELNAVKSGSTDGPTLYLDAIGFLVTSDQSCPSAPSNTIATLSLTDTYDSSYLQFVSSEPPADTTTPAGTLTWSNVGPLYPGQTKTISVTFLALAPSTNPQNINNVATAGNGYFGDGRPANSDVATATVSLAATGSIAGVVWNDNDSDGWQATNGYEVTDSRVANAAVTLYACKNGSTLITSAATNKDCSFYSGTWQVIGTQVTSSTGDYSFTGLRNGYYRVLVDQSTIPGTAIQKGDPNQKTGVCTTCDNQSNTTTDNLGATTFLGQITNANDVTNLNFGYSVLAALYGNLWQDNDSDGVQESGENGLSGATVALYNSTCTTPLDSTTTDANGNYSFGNLINATTYCVKVTTGTLPAGGTWTETAETDSSINNQISVTGATGVISGSHNFGFHHTTSSTIGDTLYYDWDGDGGQDSNEEGIPNITVFLYEDANGNGRIDAATDALVAVTSTNSSGQYLFSTLPSGSYLVVVDVVDPQFPTNVTRTGDPDETGACTICDNTGRATVNGTNAVLTRDFGYQPVGLGLIGDTVWYDKNGDGIQSGVREVGLVSVTAELWADLNGDGVYTRILTTTTDATGTYRFTNLPNGVYKVIVDAIDVDIPDDAFGNNYVPTTVTSYTATLSGGTVTELNGTACTGCNLAADFGFTALGALGDNIYWDANGDGEQDFTEIGIANVLVTLTNSTVITAGDGTVYSPGTYVITTTTADGTGSVPLGSYVFSGLPAGNYSLTVDISGPIGGAAQTADPDRDGETCTSTTYPGLPACDNAVTVTMQTGSNFMGADFGYAPSGVIGDYAWFDQNGDGVQGAGEVGIADLLVTVTNGGTTYTTTTDYNGEYSIIGLTAGLWTVTIEQPSTMTPTIGAESIGAASTTVTIDSNGDVTAIDGNTCGNCALDIDLGFAMNGDYALAGSLCLEGSSSMNGLCSDGTDLAVTTYALYLYNDDGDYLGSTTTDSNGAYTFTALIADTYYVVIGTILPPLDNATLTTTAADTPASSIVTTTTTARQIVVVDGTTAAGDGGVDANVVEGVDFAYVSTIDYDYGDLPAPYNTSLTDQPDGPRHSVPGTPTLYLGSTAPDSEDNGTASTNADSDGSDEDGVSPVDIANWTIGTNGGTTQVSVNGSGWLVGWIDFNNDGDFTDSGEMVVSQATSTGTANVTFDIPSGTAIGAGSSFYSRFRLFATKPAFPLFAYTGATKSGEVEDYLWTATPTADLTIVKYDELDPMLAGMVVTYTIVITNNGPNDAENVVITDTLPVSTTFQSASPGCTANGMSVICNFGTITVDSVVSVTISVLVDSNVVYTPHFQLDGRAAAFPISTFIQITSGDATGDFSRSCFTPMTCSPSSMAANTSTSVIIAILVDPAMTQLPQYQKELSVVSVRGSPVPKSG